MTIIELVLSLAAILGAAILFTNAVEILGDRLNLGAGAVGSVLAAVGTALPETMIPLVAIFGALLLGSGSAAASEIGIGAILGAPFLLATLALFIVGAAALGYRGRRETGSEITADRQTAIPDLVFFLVCFTPAAAAGLLSLPLLLKIVLAVALLVAYVLYVVRTVKKGGEAEEDVPARLTLWPFSSQGPTWAVAAQLIGTIAVMGRRRPLLRRRRRAPLRVRGNPGRPDRAGPRASGDGAAREVQLRHLAQGQQGHPGHRQHHRGDGLPEHHPGLGRGALYAVATRLHYRRRGHVRHPLGHSLPRVPAAQGPFQAFYMLGAGSLYIVFVVTAIIDLVRG